VQPFKYNSTLIQSPGPLMSRDESGRVRLLHFGSGMVRMCGWPSCKW